MTITTDPTWHRIASCIEAFTIPGGVLVRNDAINFQVPMTFIPGVAIELVDLGPDVGVRARLVASPAGQESPARGEVDSPRAERPVAELHLRPPGLSVRAWPVPDAALATSAGVMQLLAVLRDPETRNEIVNEAILAAFGEGGDDVDGGDGERWGERRETLVKSLDRAGVPATQSLAVRIGLAVERLGELHDAGLDREPRLVDARIDHWRAWAETVWENGHPGLSSAKVSDADLRSWISAAVAVALWLAVPSR